MIRRTLSSVAQQRPSLSSEPSVCSNFRCAPALVAVSMALLTQGCSSRRPAFSDVLEAFNPGATSSTHQKTGITYPATNSSPMSLRVFVDCSIGMKGFVSLQASGLRSNYLRVTQDMLSRVSGAGYEPTWYCLGGQHTSGAVAGQSLLQPASYQSPTNSLGSLLGMVEQSGAQSDKPGIDIVISDLAASETGESARRLATALREMDQQGRQLVLWGFRSSYVGEYTAASIQCGGKKTQLKLGQSLPGLGRPFYLLVSAPDSDSLKRWIGIFSGELLPAAEFVVSRPTVELTQAEFPKRPVDETGKKEHSAKWLPDGVESLGPMQQDKSSEFPKRVYSAFAVKGARRFIIAFPWKADLNLPLEDANETTTMPRKQIVDWPKKDVTRAPDDLKVTAEASLDEQHFTYTVSFPVPDTKWRIYRIPLNAGDKAKPPEWISDWSTTSDCDASAGNRTLQLHDVGQALVDVFLRDRPFVEHYIAVRR